MSRSVKKGPFIAPELLKRVEEMNQSGKKTVLKTWSRSSTIYPAFVGHTIAVYDGRKQLHHLPRLRGPHHCRVRRPQACACLHPGGYGRPQAG